MTQFGWLSPVAGHAGSDFQPIVMYQEEHILPQALPHFDSVWIADHFYGFDAEKKATLSALSRVIPIVLSPNMSVGVNLMIEVAALLARTKSPIRARPSPPPAASPCTATTTGAFIVRKSSWARR